MTEEPYKQILCLDFDGVIHRYSNGWQNGEIYDRATAGFFDWAEEAKKVFKLVIYSSRSKTPEGVAAMREWMGAQIQEWRKGRDEFSLWPDDFEYASEKPTAFLTIDDRAIQFEGSWSITKMNPRNLKKFAPWTYFENPAKG